MPRRSSTPRESPEGSSSIGDPKTIFTQGDPCESVLYIQKGGVKLSVLSKTGREAVVAMLGPGDFFGEGCLAGQSVRMGSATAITGSTILLVDKDQMVRLLHEQHGLSDRFIAHMLARNIRIEEDLVDQLFNSSEKRLARTLLLLARYGKRAGHTAEGRPEDLAGDARGNGRHDAVAGEFLHEQVQAAGVHRLQRWAQGPQLAAHRRPARLTSSSKARTAAMANARQGPLNHPTPTSSLPVSPPFPACVLPPTRKFQNGTRPMRSPGRFVASVGGEPAAFSAARRMRQPQAPGDSDGQSERDQYFPELLFDLLQVLDDVSR